MTIWKRDISLESLNANSKNTLIEHLGIVYTEISDNSLTATMIVGPNTHQPFGLLHGGASVVLAESLGSYAAYHCCEGDSHCVGLEVNANHLKAVRSGTVTGVATPIHLGRTTHIWSIEIRDEQGSLVCISRHTVMVRNPKKKAKV
ncbi:hotdog fold thioesterase [Vibrio breoganii]|uniref:hotdog fold thioesterase n=1 Tax=Vibrio breoganii TaxID=553239 RepID=UPI000C865F32|nr:hotdog fold thioesterase [Vibrio breoganii]PMJ47043.1 esterase [Vibrio breoganii]PMK58443.1 esterase [Vibrio breoganii]PMO28727.1 esterase [Vibrio breoganii]PMO36640.1 esterase [Vibrio breoganii]PMO60469.1 esterase [Vibrio breoganii]